ncbi:hypothetical protein [Parachlamydia sp. AcF125]|uniref:hypothetical protein n=1 Tax=Parachlamydia sp. AcF125 TaxID=2795736 RepID=UPI001BC9A74A|nr:hypothetical protein [Parachlamydia sp. AcF125]MBS4167468.1 hypothetical protein [Parachlamydia sp. AcF125]
MGMSFLMQAADSPQHEAIWVDSQVEIARKYCEWAVKYNYVYVEKDYKKDVERRCKKAALACIGGGIAVGAGTGAGIGAAVGLPAGPIGAAAVGGMGAVAGGLVGLLSGAKLAMETMKTIQVNASALQKRIEEEEKTGKDAADRFNKFLKSVDFNGKYECPYGLKIIDYPVRGPDNVVYERVCIEAWIDKIAKDGKGVASAYGEMDFGKEDLVFDYRTAIDMKKDLAIVVREKLEVSTKEHRFFREALFAKIKDLELEVETCLEGWMKALNENRLAKEESISSLAEKYARLAHEFEVQPEVQLKSKKQPNRMHLKIELILGSEWGEKEREYFDSCYRTKTPAYLYEKGNEYCFNI